MRSKPAEILAVAFTVANLFFFSSWAKLFQVTKGTADLMTRYLLPSPYPASYAAVFIAVFLLTILLAGFLFLAGKWGPKTGAAAYVLLLLFFIAPLNSLGYELFSEPPKLLTKIHVGLGLAFVWIVFFYFGQKKPEPTVRFCRNFYFLFLPFAILGFLQGGWGISVALFDRSALVPLKQVTNPASDTKIIWIIFDEMEQHTAFDFRPRQLALPELDRFRRQAFSASEAYPPGNRTMLSLPSYLTGKTVTSVRPLGARDASLKFEDGSRQKWSVVSDIFERTRARGLKTAAIGFYHPYCRLMANRLDFCSFLRIHLDFSDHLNESLARVAQSFFPVDIKADYEYGIRKLLTDVQTVARDPQVGFVFAHLPIPHAPWKFDSKSKQFTSAIYNVDEGYVGNLALADWFLGKLRHDMEKNHVWDKSIVLITSDHWWRDYQLRQTEADHRIPYLIKLVDQKQGFVYNKPFNTILTQSLLENLQSHAESTASTIVQFIERYPPPKDLLHARN